jgi:hypothetical protein
MNVKTKFTKSNVRAFNTRQHNAAMKRVAAIESMQWAPQAPTGAIPIGPDGMSDIFIANEAVFTQQYFDEPLTTYAVGWRDPNNIDQTLEFFAPETPAPRRFTYKEWINIEEFLAEGTYDDLRAIGSEFPTVKFTGKETHARTENRGLRLRVDLDEVASPDSPLAGGIAAYQQRAVAKILRRLARNSVRRAIALISAAAVNTAKTWDTTPAKDPDQDVLSELVLGTTASGLRPNRVGYGETAWTKRGLSHRAQNTAGGYASAGLTMDQVASLFGTMGYVSRERFSALGNPLLEIIGNLVLMFFAMGGADIEDPSNVKRFVSPTDAGGPIRVYVQQVTSKLVDITVEKYELIKITSTLGIRQFTIS